MAAGNPTMELPGTLLQIQIQGEQAGNLIGSVMDPMDPDGSLSIPGPGSKGSYEQQRRAICATVYQ